MNRFILLAASLFAATDAQRACEGIEEVHPPFNWHDCYGDSCFERYAAVVLDSKLRQIDCCNGSRNTLQRAACKKKNKDQCPVDCCIHGADYGAHGIFTNGTDLTLDVGASHPNTPKDLIRVMLMKDENHYEWTQIIDPWDSEYTFDVEVRDVPPGYKARLSLHWMWEKGNMDKKKGDKAGAKYGTGYCDAHCDQGQRFVMGRANYDGWEPSQTDPHLGTGHLGACCIHLVLWEGNTHSTDFGHYPCDPRGPHMCKGIKCKMDCYSVGCTWNPNGKDQKPFYGPGKTNTIDSSRKFSVVNQWFSTQKPMQPVMTRRVMYYIQDGKLIPSAPSDFRTKKKEFHTMDKGFCAAQAKAWGLGKWLKKNPWWVNHDAWQYDMVPVFSLVRDYEYDMLQGFVHGDDKLKSIPINASVTFSNFRYGRINRTFTGLVDPEYRPRKPGGWRETYEEKCKGTCGTSQEKWAKYDREHSLKHIHKIPPPGVDK
ncbi:exoglucanase type C [Fusarium beomiforme]|uniref:Glucanase n=1 Tax=Fusarium beomiforme TaxID=44412 RepID=A0A9P5ASM6_9HYPO|nr:exoglucanase type C [Fusarium beomiforme]